MLAAGTASTSGSGGAHPAANEGGFRIYRELLNEGITRYRKQAWVCSSECKNLIHIILAMGTRPCYASSVPQILVAHLPHFLMQSPEDAFFAMLDNPALSIFDHDLRAAVWTFLGAWPYTRHLATYKCLLMDEHMFQVSSRCLPANVPLHTWIQRRMSAEIYFAEGDVRHVGTPRDDCQVMVTSEGHTQVIAAYEHIDNAVVTEATWRRPFQVR